MDGAKFTSSFLPPHTPYLITLIIYIYIIYKTRARVVTNDNKANNVTSVITKLTKLTMLQVL